MLGYTKSLLDENEIVRVKYVKDSVPDRSVEDHFRNIGNVVGWTVCTLVDTTEIWTEMTFKYMYPTGYFKESR